MDDRQNTMIWEKMAQISTDLFCTLDRNGYFQHVNPASQKILGHPSECLIKKHFTEFVHPEFSLSICPDFTPETLPNNFKCSFIHQNGFPVFLHWSFVWSEEEQFFYAIGRDVTPSLKFNTTIQEQTNILSTIFDSMTGGFYLLDRNWNFIFINREAEKLYFKSREKFIGKNIWEAFPSEVNSHLYRQYHCAMETGKSVNFEIYFEDADSWFEGKAYPSAAGLAVYFDDITEKIRTREELKKLSLVASHTNNGVIITNSDRQIEWVNEGFTRLTGYNKEEVIGKIPSEFLHNPNTDLKAFEAVKSKMLKGEPTAFEILNTRKDGKNIWVSVQVNPIFNDQGQLERYITIQTDITYRIKAQQELEKLSLVANKTNNGVLLADKDWKIEWVNPGFTRLYGYDLEEAIGKKPSELLHSPKTNVTSYFLLEEKLLKGEPITYEILNLKKNGEEVWISLEVTAIFDENGALVRFIEVETDITPLKNSELELARLAKDLYRQNKDLQQFTYIVSHNLRAPVANALGMAEILTLTNKTSELYDLSLANLNKCIQQLDTVLKDINTILSIRDSKGNLELENVIISTVIEKVVASLQEPMQNCEGEVLVEVAEDLTLLTNKAYLYSIFYNLLSNAIKYRSDERSLKVRVKSYGNSRKGIIISFSDNGSGFDLNKAKDNIFKLYKRFHRDNNGRGIGLYLVKTHLETMGGNIEVTSQLGLGTRFLIYIPHLQYENIHN